MDKFVDVRRLIAEKNPKVLKWLPGFAIRRLERLLHQDEVNAFMHANRDANALDFSTALMKMLNVNASAEGLENIPREPSPCIIVANHPLGGLDAIAMIHLLREVRPDLKFIVNDFLMSVRNLRERFVGVNKVGKTGARSLQDVENQFASGTATVVFPAGLVSRRVNGKIEDLNWTKTFVSKAVKYGKPVVPVHITGRLSNRFYRLANIRKRLGIKFNIEMMFLVDEFFKQKNCSIRFTIGSPIPAETFTGDKTPQAWAGWVKEKVYQLKNS